MQKKVVDKLVEECTENIDENKLISKTVNDYKNVCGSCTVYNRIISHIFYD